MKRRWRVVAGLGIIVASVALLSWFYSISRHMHKIETFVDVRPATNTSLEEQSPEEILDEIIARMSPREKVGQLVMVNYFGNDYSRVASLVTNYHVGGLMLKAENIQNKTYQQVKEQNRNLQKIALRVPVFISVDQEGGDVARLQYIIKNYPPPLDLYRTMGRGGVEESARYYSSRMRDLNIHINFSPVLDVVQNNGSIIYNRIFSANSEENAELSKSYADIFQENGIIAVPKHFPGYGTVNKDPHFEVCRDYQSDITPLIAPFTRFSGSPMVMTSHVIFSRYDERPATLSKTILSKLRGQNFSNIIITDDIQMKSITQLYDFERAAVDALNAGCDIVLSVTQTEPDWYQNAVKLVTYLEQAYQDKRLSAEEVDRSLRRVLRVKLSYIKDAQWSILKNGEKSYFHIIADSGY